MKCEFTIIRKVKRIRKLQNNEWKAERSKARFAVVISDINIKIK